MSIKMDGHVITALELHGADGNVITKNLVEESAGALKSITGYREFVGTTIYNADFTIPNAGELSGCTSFIVLLQLVESGLLATPGDPESEVTMYEHPQSYDNGVLILSHALINTGIFADFDTTIVYPQTKVYYNTLTTEISVSNMPEHERISTVSIVNGDLVLNIQNVITAHKNMYHKFKYTVYGA